MTAGCWIDAGAGYQLFTWDDGRAARPERSLGRDAAGPARRGVDVGTSFVVGFPFSR